MYVEIAPALNDTKDTYREAERRYGSLNANLLEVISLKDRVERIEDEYP